LHSLRPARKISAHCRTARREGLHPLDGVLPESCETRAARTIEVHGGEKISDLRFSVGKGRLHTVLFYIVSADGSLLPLAKFGVSIDAPARDALAYHLTQTRSINGEFPARYVPSGELLVQTYLRPDLKTGKIPAELMRWRMARQEMCIGTDSEIILTLSRAN
jgi:hypothetical protein